MMTTNVANLPQQYRKAVDNDKLYRNPMGSYSAHYLIGHEAADRRQRELGVPNHPLEFLFQAVRIHDYADEHREEIQRKIDSLERNEETPELGAMDWRKQIEVFGSVEAVCDFHNLSRAAVLKNAYGLTPQALAWMDGVKGTMGLDAILAHLRTMGVECRNHPLRQFLLAEGFAKPYKRKSAEDYDAIERLMAEGCPRDQLYIRAGLDRAYVTKIVFGLNLRNRKKAKG